MFGINRHRSWQQDPITPAQLRDLAERRPDLVEVVIQGKDLLLRAVPAIRGPRRQRMALRLHGGRLLYPFKAKAPQIEWMLAVAGELSARLTDNRIQTYRNATETYLHAEDVEADRKHAMLMASLTDGSYWRRWRWEQRLVVTAIVGFFVLLAALAIGVLRLFGAL